MAGDWIKMRADLQTHPKVVRISSALCSDRLRAIGALHAVWSLFDAHSIDGSLIGYTPDALDALIGWPGFSMEMHAVGWLEVGGDSLALPRFDEHNGKSAKRRATETERKRASRMATEVPQSARKTSAFDADKTRTREEKRREEETPHTSKGEPDGFKTFWEVWPKSERKQARGKCCEAWGKLKTETVASEVIAHVQSMISSESWTKQGGQFIPAPLTYLNGRRWEGAVNGSSSSRLELIGGI